MGGAASTRHFPLALHCLTVSPSPTQSALGALQILSYVRGERIHDSTDLQALASLAASVVATLLPLPSSPAGVAKLRGRSQTTHAILHSLGQRHTSANRTPDARVEFAKTTLLWRARPNLPCLLRGAPFHYEGTRMRC